jgi:hypothetical protein
MIVKLNESALLAAGFDRAFVEFLRHTMRQLGDITHETTLPEVAAQTDILTPIVTALTITLTATNVTVGEILADQVELPQSDRHIMRQLEDMQAEFDAARIERSELLRQIEVMQAEVERAQLDRAALFRSMNCALTNPSISTSRPFPGASPHLRTHSHANAIYKAVRAGSHGADYCHDNLYGPADRFNHAAQGRHSAYYQHDRRSGIGHTVCGPAGRRCRRNERVLVE